MEYLGCVAQLDHTISSLTHGRIQLITRVHVACDPLRCTYSGSSQHGVSAQAFSAGRMTCLALSTRILSLVFNLMNLPPQPAFAGPSAAVLLSGQQPYLVSQQFSSVLWREREREKYSVGFFLLATRTRLSAITRFLILGRRKIGRVNSNYVLSIYSACKVNLLALRLGLSQS